MLVITKLDSVDIRGDSGGVFPGTLVVTTEVLGEFLVEVEHHVSDAIASYHCVGPQLLHEEHLICEVGWRACRRDGGINGRVSGLNEEWLVGPLKWKG